MQKLEDIDATSPDILQDPYDYYARLREEAPVFRDPKTGIVGVSSYDLVLEVNKYPKIFSSDTAVLLATAGSGPMSDEELAILSKGLPPRNTMLTADPPEHSRYKRIALKALPHTRVMGMKPYVAEVTNALIDDFIADGEVEFRSQFAERLPAIVVADLLGIPREDISKFSDWVAGSIRRLTGMSTPEERPALAQKIVDMQMYFAAAFKERRKNPKEDVLTDLIQAAYKGDEGERPLDDGEIFSIAQQIFTAGQEATAHTLTYAIAQLLRHPDQLEAMRGDPALIDAMVEETTRHLSPSHNMWRIVKQDTTLGGVELKAGDVMQLRYGAANRDETRFKDAGVFDIRRENLKDNLAFGAGIHTCLGATLARVEITAALPIILDRLKNLRLVEPGEPIRFAPTPILRGVAALHLKFDAD